MDLAAGVLAGERLALARLITQVENDTPQGRAALNVLFPHTGKAHLVGITGSPGTGKSSLVNRLALALRHPEDGATPLKVGIVAVDPSSPFTGGAILGDRVRMRDLAGDPGVFIRSMASRGQLGGLARTTAMVVQVMDAAGFDMILIETVGAGQSEVEIARLAHTTLVVEAPGMGDDIQAIKAGILEIADVLVINKADRPGADSTERALKAMLEFSNPDRVQPGMCHTEGFKPAELPGEKMTWHIPVLRTIATTGEGSRELAQAILQHRAYLQRTGEWQQRERQRLQAELENLIQAMLVARWRKEVGTLRFEHTLDELLKRRTSPYEAMINLLNLVEHTPQSS